jgi:WD40 repeat protein
VAITPDGRYTVSISVDKTLRVWELIWKLEFE